MVRPLRVELRRVVADDLSDRLDRSLARLQQHPYSPVFVCSDVSFEMPRIFNEFSGDISGRYIEVFSLAGLSGRPNPQLAGIVRRVMSHQQPEGYFGAKGFSRERLGDRETKIFWGNGRLLIGLLEYYRLTHEADILAAAQRIGRFLLECNIRFSAASVGEEVQDGGAAGFATTFCSCIEGVVRLYEELGDPAYAELARGMVSLLPDELDGFHSHGRVTALRGALELARCTQDETLRARVVRQWEAIAQDHVTCLGGLREYFGHGCTRDEGCSVADWVMLSLGLHRVCGEPRYADAAEHALLNHLLANQTGNGGFGHLIFQLEQPEGAPFRLLTGIGRQWGRPVEDSPTEAYWCCSFHGPRALLEYSHHLATRPTADSIRIDHYTSSNLTADDACFRLDTDPYLRAATLTVLTAPPEDFTFRFRVPGWSRTFQVSVMDAGRNLVAETTRQEGPYAEVTRHWIKGDRVSLDLGAGLRTGSTYSASEQICAQEKESVFFGPFLLGFDPTDALLWGQNMSGHIVSRVVLPDEWFGAWQPTCPAKVLVEYYSETLNRTIWVTRLFTPTMNRLSCETMRTVVRVERRPYAALTGPQQEELVSWR